MTRLDARLDGLDVPSNREIPRSREPEVSGPAARNPAPILLIRDAATDAGVRLSQPEPSVTSSFADVVSNGLVDLSTASSLVQLYVDALNFILSLSNTL